MQSKRISDLLFRFKGLFLVLFVLGSVNAWADTLPANDPRYAEYKQIRDRYQQLWVDYGLARNNEARQRAIVRDVQALHRRVNELRQNDSVSNPNRSAYSEELAERLGRLYVDSNWDISPPGNDLKRRYTKTRTDGSSYSPYLRLQALQDIYDDVSATLARPNLTAAQRTAALARLQKDVITQLDNGITAISADANVNNEVLQMLRALRSDARSVQTAAETNRPKSIQPNIGIPKPIIPGGARPVDWRTSARTYRGQRVRVTYICPANSISEGPVWGTDLYTDDSSVCQAAVHFGLITHRSGGRVTFEMRAGGKQYRGSTRNGVSSAGYYSWPGSYVFVGR